LLEQRFGCLMGSKGANLLLHTWTLTVEFWIIMAIPDEMKKVFGDPAVATFSREFSTELKTAVAQLWRGAMIRQ
jgi:hypothetical protein